MLTTSTKQYNYLDEKNHGIWRNTFQILADLLIEVELSRGRVFLLHFQYTYSAQNSKMKMHLLLIINW